MLSWLLFKETASQRQEVLCYCKAKDAVWRVVGTTAACPVVLPCKSRRIFIQRVLANCRKMRGDDECRHERMHAKCGGHCTLAKWSRAPPTRGQDCLPICELHDDAIKARVDWAGVVHAGAEQNVHAAGLESNWCFGVQHMLSR